ncbi:restriction endonuclease subunit S [Vibrio cyclitrophicus]
MNNNLIPSLRFDGFFSALQPYQLIELSEDGLSNGVFNDTKLVGSGYRLINVKDMYIGNRINVDELTLLNIGEKEFKRNQVKYGDIFFTRSSIVPDGIAYSNVNLSYADDLTFDGHLMRMSPNLDLVVPAYLSAKLKTWTMRKRLISRGKQSTMTTIGQSDISDLLVEIPTIDEQQKIADFLTSVDTKISQLTEKHCLFKEYKKGVMQQIFSQKIRFKDENGNAFPEWGAKHFCDVFTRVTTKNKEYNENVLTISAQKGLVSQLEYFNKSVAAKDVSGYYLLHKGDFAYNKSYSQGYPMGAIKPLKRYEKGVVSTLYICFRPKAKFSDAYFEQFFDAGMLNREIAKVAQEGARNHGLLNVSVKEFFDDIKLTVPTLDEQKKIAQFLQSIDTKIEGVAEQIEQTKQFKKGLLQQMFV